MRISILFFWLGSVPLPWRTMAGLPFTFRELELKAHFPSCLWLVRNLEQVNLLPLRSFWIFSRKLMKKYCPITKSSMPRLPLTTECGLVVCESFVTPTPVREILNSMRKCYKSRKKRKPNCCLHVLHFLSSQAPPIPNAWLSKVLWEGLIQRAYHCPKGQWISSANIGQANPMLRIVFHVGRL